MGQKCKHLGAVLTANAQFDGRYEFPLIKNTENLSLPHVFIPFDKRRKAVDRKHSFVHFYMHDQYFKQLWRKGCRYVEELRAFGGVIAPDFSLYRDMPLALQIYNTYRSRAVGAYFQDQGLCVVPNVRWADKRSFAFCFDGLELGGIYAISTHDCMKSVKERQHFVRGLDAMLERLKPQRILVHGRMHPRVFAPYDVEFVRYPSWLEMVKEARHGRRN